MDVNGEVIAISLPSGAYATREAYFSALQDAGRDQHPKQLKCFGVKFDPAQPFVSAVILHGCPSCTIRPSRVGALADGASNHCTTKHRQKSIACLPFLRKGFSWNPVEYYSSVPDSNNFRVRFHILLALKQSGATYAQ